jgi:hypothetical protein
MPQYNKNLKKEKMESLPDAHLTFLNGEFKLAFQPLHLFPFSYFGQKNKEMRKVIISFLGSDNVRRR